MSSGKAGACKPTWQGHIETTKDALLIFEACFQGHLAHCSRRPHDRERSQLIVSGNVFVYEEATSGIKRWTDGIPWSPSRILTNFLIYRQLNSPFPPGEKKRATKRSQRPIKSGESYATSSPSGTPTTDENRSFIPPPESPTANVKSEDSYDKDVNRGLVGSLVDSYEFKENGLLKKTMTVTVNNVQHHLVSYYSLEDAKTNLKTPRDDPNLRNLQIRPTLLSQPKFKFPNLDDAGDGTYEGIDQSQHVYPGGYYPNGFEHSRLYPPNAAMHHAQVSSPLGAYHGAYAPSNPPHSSQGFAPIAPTSSSYTPGTTVQYPQHQGISQHHPYGHLGQQAHYQGHPGQHYAPPHYPVQQHHPSDVSLQHSNYPPQGTTLPRPSGAAGYQSQGENVASPNQQQQHAQQAQDWPGPYSSQQWPPSRQESQYSQAYRPQS